MTRVQITGVHGLPEVNFGDDLAALLAGAAPELSDGDVLVVTSKVVSKAEGRVQAGDRDAAVDGETARLVARRGATRIVQTHHGFVLAAAGVDASNTEPGTVVLLPRDPDASARRIRAGLRARLGVSVAVVVSDTFGRPWRGGVTDVAVGLAGMDALDDLRGRTDAHGNTLDATVTAVADEVAGAAELVKGKLAHVPAAVVRGLGDRVSAADGAGVRPMLRPATQDMFRYGSRDVVTARRTVGGFSDTPVDPSALRRAVATAITAPAPGVTAPWRFVLVESVDARKRLLDAVLAARVTDPQADAFVGAGITGETSAANSAANSAADVLLSAPELVVPCRVMLDHPDARGATAERDTYVLSAGAAVENLLVALTAEGLGSCWVPPTTCPPAATRRELGLPPLWEPVGTVAVGHPAQGAGERQSPETPDPADFIAIR